MPCVLAMFLLTPLGLTMAFVGAVKGEVPKVYFYIGFFLNLAVFLIPIVGAFIG